MHNYFYSSLEEGIVSAAVCGKVGETATQICQHSTVNFQELKQCNGHISVLMVKTEYGCIWRVIYLLI